MDGKWLLETTRRALARESDQRGVVTEVWRAQALTEVVGDFLATHGPGGLRASALALAESGGRAREALSSVARQAEGVQNRSLTTVEDTDATLRALGELLNDAGVALVAAICAAEDEHMYWSCAEAIDAVDDAKSRVTDLLRLLAEEQPRDLRSRHEAPGKHTPGAEEPRGERLGGELLSVVSLRKSSPSRGHIAS